MNESNYLRHSPTARGKRPTCQNCKFPPRTCICPALPPSPLHPLFRKCRIITLQHPHELRRKNRSLPLVDLCLFGSSQTSSDDLQPGEEFVMKTVVGRGFGPDRDASIVDILNDLEQVIVMVFPHQTAMDLEQGIKLAEERCRLNTNDENCEIMKMTLLFLDATWKHAREMDAKISKTLDCKHWIRVHLLPNKLDSYQRYDGADQTAERADTKDDTEVGVGNNNQSTTQSFIQRRFQIRAPPSPNHLSTAECIAWVASRIEQNPEIFESITKVLDYMVYLWRGNAVLEKRESEQGWDGMSQKSLEIKHN